MTHRNTVGWAHSPSRKKMHFSSMGHELILRVVSLCLALIALGAGPQDEGGDGPTVLAPAVKPGPVKPGDVKETERVGSVRHERFGVGICCPIYCLMPDHMHLLWIGITDGCDQRNAMKFFRQQVNAVLEKLDTAFQTQSYDHVLREEERERTAFEDVAEYIARNPERKGLVPADGFADYSYTGCIVPGYPNLNPFQDAYWDLFWRLYSRLRTEGLTRSVSTTET